MRRRGLGAAVNSGEVSWSLRSTDSTTCGAGAMLTSLRGSLATSRRRNDGGGKESKAAVARVCGTRTSEGGGLGEGVQGAAGALNSPVEHLGVRPRGDVVLQPDSGGVAAEFEAGTTPRRG
jgi:hypothetical protein